MILDYVQEEILEPLPERQQRFLLHTSVLERMNAEVCQTLTGEHASQQMLEELERANHFLIPLDEERRWARSPSATRLCQKPGKKEHHPMKGERIKNNADET